MLLRSTYLRAHRQSRKPEMRRNEVAQNLRHKDRLTNQEIWNTIRYLDPDLQCSRIAAVVFGVVLICMVALAFCFRTP